MSDEVQLPEVSEVRNRIESIPEDDVRFATIATYLWGARISEVIGKASPRDNTKARGLRGEEMKEETFRQEVKRGDREVWEEEPVFLFPLKTAKRGGFKRNVALSPTYEPWATALAEYFRVRLSEFVFPFTRQYVWKHIKEPFKGMKYTIVKYKIYKDGKVQKEKLQHSREFALHALRHLRATELVERYRFDAFDLSIYLGWTLPGVMGRYLSLDWGRYFPKLLKRRV